MGGWMDTPESRTKHRQEQQKVGEDAHYIAARLDSDPLIASETRFNGMAQSYELLVSIDGRDYMLKMVRF